MRLIIATGCLLACLVSSPSSAGAAAAAGLDADIADVNNSEAAPGVAPSPTTASSCAVEGWEWYEQSDVTLMAGSGYKTEGLLTYRLGRPTCDGVPGAWMWITIADDGLAIRNLYAEARGRVPKPLPEFVPPLEPWQFRNHPMRFWFSDAQLAMPTLSANLPSGSGITMAPRVVSVSFEPGNGEATVVCDKPKPLAEGDCSYKYPETSKDAPNLTFPAKVLITWEFPWRTSDGRSGSLGPATFATDVGIKVAKVMAIRA